MGRRFALTLGAALVLAFFGMAKAALQASTTEGPGGGDPVTQLLGPGPGAPESPAGEGGRRIPFSRADMQLSFAPLVKGTAPAVVNVYATQAVDSMRSPFGGDPFFEQFFGRGRPRSESSLGSGVLVDASGVVVTNYHVIKDADEVKVATSDGREFASKTLLKDETLDLAVLKIDGGTPFATAPIGDSDSLEVGDLVLAIGNPFGVGQTTTSGIVSALARTHVGVSDSGFFIQTDAAINPGNSGGALIDMSGHLVGINTAIYSRSGGSIGIGFAIPSNMVRAFVQAAMKGSDYFERPYIGADFEEVTPQIAESLGMARGRGALIASVSADGPAAKAGLQPGEVVLALNGRDVENVEALNYRLATLDVGSTATLRLLRQGREADAALVLARAPEAANAAPVLIRGRSPFSGAKVAELSPRLAQRLGLRSDLSGVTVVDIDRGSPADGFGFQPRDIVREVNGTSIDTPERLAEIAGQGARAWRFTVERDGRLIRQAIRF